MAAFDVPPARRARTWVAGECRVCGSSYLCKYGSSTCGDTCQQEWWREVEREAKQRRRARKREAFVAPVRRRTVYARDHYTCQLCYRPLDMTAVTPMPDSPTIDHVIPLARGGTHEPANVQAAHFLCNAIKGDREYVFELTAPAG